MAAFEKVKLLTGEFRAEYILRRLGEGAEVRAILTEINSPEMYSGPAGRSWAPGVVYTEKNKLEARAKKATKPVQTAARSELKAEMIPDSGDEQPIDVSDVEVPPEYEDILDAADIAEVRAEAAAQIKAEQRKQARKDMLARARVELKREAALAAEKGSARLGLEDVYVDLAPAVCIGKAKVDLPPSIVLDGRHYIHGTTVRVNKNVAAVLREQMQRSWNHEGTLHGNDENAYRRPRLQQVRGASGNGVRA